MYSGYKLCNDLEPKQKCFRLQQYNEGIFDDVFHEHVPRRRISQRSGIEMIRALVLRYNEFAAPYILRCYLNSRGRDPEAIPLLRIVIEYPEPGVLRRYCCSNHFQAWMDEVVGPGEFRQ